MRIWGSVIASGQKPLFFVFFFLGGPPLKGEYMIDDEIFFVCIELYVYIPYASNRIQEVRTGITPDVEVGNVERACRI